MRVKSITIEVARTINTGNYNSVRIGLQETLEFDEEVEFGSEEHRKAYKDGMRGVTARVDKEAEKYEASE